MIFQAIYTISFAILNQWLLPTFLRQQKWIAWINVFTTPIKQFHESKQLWRASIRYKLRHNGQVIYLEKMLNEFHNIVGYDHQDHQNTKQIYIGPGEQLFPTYLYNEAEQQPVYVYNDAESNPIYIYDDLELEAVYADFIIWVPVALNYTEAQIRALVDYYIDTRIYKVKTY